MGAGFQISLPFVDRALMELIAPLHKVFQALTPAPFSITFVRAREASISHLSFPIDGHCFIGL
jgi:hypothetical protein